VADTVLICGASKGIGLATARLLESRGFAVIGVARSEPAGFPGAFHSADLADRASTQAMLGRVLASHPSITGLVNCAGLNIPEPLGEVDLDHLHQVLDLNIRSAVQVAQALLPQMKAARYGRIVNISSRGALGRPKRTAYSAAKAGIVGMSRTWALELAPFGITVNVVSPGPTETEMFRRNNLVGPQAEENRRFFLADVPMGRFGQPEEIAAAIAFFLGRDAGFITGQVLHACGGSSVGPAPL
jgi:NAD(P)-dependent dehydrogenase (short-subunit alcohol dehydrogenase family)